MDAKIITRDYIKDFFRLSDSEQDISLLNHVISRLQLKEYAHNSFICRIGDEANEMFFIESGTILVRGKDGEVNNELQPGRYFGEYAAITGDKRMADIQAHGTVQVYVLKKETLLDLTKQHSGLYGMFLKNVYAQSTEKYRKLTNLLNLKRGLGSGSERKTSLSSLIRDYSFVVLFFLIAFIFASNPAMERMHPVWLCSPLIFIVIYMIMTHRALETLLIASIYSMFLLSKFNFIGKFSDYLLYATKGVSEIILIILLMGSLTRLFSASGSINALRDIIQRKIKSVKGTFFASFLSMIVIALDEYLSVLINSICFKPLIDEKRVSREKSAIIMGLTPSALCILNPLSIIGIYLAGVIAISGEEKSLFLDVIRYNYGAFFALVFILLLIMGKIPLLGGLKKAQIRVDEGGSLWPEGTDVNESEDEHSRGRLVNLFLPVLVFFASSIITGSLAAGSFQINVLYGMCVTMIFMFFLYCFQQYMTPDQFFKHFIYGIESMIAPVVLFVVGKCFAYGMDALGFTTWLIDIVHGLIYGQIWLLAPIIFVVCVLVAAVFNDFWAVFVICIPIAVSLAASFNGNIALYLGAVCSAGFLGNELAHGNMDFIGYMIGINPKSYFRAKRPYIMIIIVLTFFAFVAAGLLGL